MSDGRVFVLGGSWIGGVGNKNGEVRSVVVGMPSAGSWASPNPKRRLYRHRGPHQIGSLRPLFRAASLACCQRSCGLLAV